MNLEIRHHAARLASPVVAAEHLVAEVFVKLGLEPHGRPFWSDPIQSRRLLGDIIQECLSFLAGEELEEP